MDMPKSCCSCNMCNSNDECILQDEDANFKASDSWEELRKGCPLKPMPEKKKERYGMERQTSTGHRETYGEETDSVAVGYNACIDEILGDKE